MVDFKQKHCSTHISEGNKILKYVLEIVSNQLPSELCGTVLAVLLGYNLQEL